MIDFFYVVRLDARLAALAAKKAKETLEREQQEQEQKCNTARVLCCMICIMRAFILLFTHNRNEGIHNVPLRIINSQSLYYYQNKA